MNKHKESFRREIQQNIQEFGFHITTVIGGQEPRYSYSVGLKDKIGLEFIFAGGIYYLKDSFYQIFSNCLFNYLNSNLNEKNYEFEEFNLSHVDSSWSAIMASGVFDYYDDSKTKFMQIIPKNHVTKDIPDLSKIYNSEDNKIWKWLEKDWDYEVPASSTVITNLDVLKGVEPIREVMRWEDDEWEMFSSEGSKFEKKEIRVVPLGLLLGMDEAILAALDLNIGKGIWRNDEESPWHKWD